MSFAKFAAKMGTLLTGVGVVALSGAAGEKLLGGAVGSKDAAFGLGFSLGAMALGFSIPPIAKVLNQDDSIADAQAVQIGLHNFSTHFGILGVLLSALIGWAFVKTGLAPQVLATDRSVPRILPVRFWKWLLLALGGCFLVAIVVSILYAWISGTPVGK